MAQRRMFSLKIVDSDAFMDMSQTAQLLYFHLSMRADDDGFIGNPKKIMRMIGSGDDDMRVLLAKRFLLTFESGIIVIKHWKIHNYIQNDRYSETQYIDEKKSLFTKENGAYTDRAQNVSRLDTQVRLGKVRLGKDTTLTLESEDDFNEFWKTYPKKTGKGAAEKSWKRIRPSKELASQIIESLAAHKLDPQWTKDNGQYIPMPATYLNQKRWLDDCAPEQITNYKKY